MLNKAILMGRLVADPEVRQTTTGVSVASFTLAVNRNYAKPGEERPTDFIDIVAWRHTAEFVGKYFTKGMQVAVSGSIQTRMWEDKQGQKRKSVEVVAEDVYFADSKRSDSAPRGDYSAPSFATPAAAAPAAPAPSYTSPQSDFQELSDDDDGLPF